MRAGLVQRLDHNTAKNNTHDYHQHKTKNHGSANGDQGLVEAGYGFAVEIGLNLVDLLDDRGCGCIESFAAGNNQHIVLVIKCCVVIERKDVLGGKSVVVRID